MKYFVVPLFALVALFSSHAVAQDRNPLADRENRVPPVISYFQGQGIRFTSIGEAGGLKGYLAESATGHQQVFYITPDGKHAIAGVMIRMDGTMVTGIQLGEMRARFEAAAQAFGGKSGQEGDLSGEQVSEVLSGIEEKETEVEEFLGDNAANEEVSDAKDASDDIIPDVDNGAGVDQSAVLLPPAEGLPSVQLVIYPNLGLAR